MHPVLPLSFYARPDVETIARQLLGKVLYTCFDGQKTAAVIVETEAYSGENDRACHSCIYGKTKRTEVMFGRPGAAYVYLCYGIHHLFNVVTNTAGKADAVLIRAAEPLEGIDIMRQRRNKTSQDASLCSGPGNLSKALGITTAAYGTDLTGETISIRNPGSRILPSQIAAVPRVGVHYAGDDALLLRRFYIKNNPNVSKPL